MEEGQRFKERQQESSESEEEVEEVNNPEMKGFLKGIELMEDDDVSKDNKNNSFVPFQMQYTVDFDEEKHHAEWSPLYYALDNLEKILT